MGFLKVISVIRVIWVIRVISVIRLRTVQLSWAFRSGSPSDPVQE